MEGIYLIDKPEGITSFDVIRTLRKILKTKTIGHAGTLDPMATGLLIVLVGRTTKLSELFLSKTKVYEATITFGYATDTYDRTGQKTLEKTDFMLSEPVIQQTMAKMRLTTKQKPPIYSAIKKQGKKLYEYARQEETVELVDRPISIYQFSLDNIEGNNIKTTLSVSKGTYIRSIAHDMGILIDIPAHLSQLRRVKSGDYSVEDAYKLEQITESTAPSLSLRAFANQLPKVEVEDYMIPLIKNGIRLDERQTNLNEPFVAMSKTGELLAIYEKDVNNYKPMLQLGVQDANTNE